MAQPNTLARGISPPPLRRSGVKSSNEKPDGNLGEQNTARSQQNTKQNGPRLAAIEAGEAEIRDHLAYFSQHLKEASRSTPSTTPRITISDFETLYTRNQHFRGRHFVIHQHDHPISGVHYDLRLQFSESSTLSFAIPYGMPGNPNSTRPNRMAIETRVHNLWNNLIESASHSTGSLLIWDTGEYEVLPYRETVKPRTTDDELSDSGGGEEEQLLSDSEKLFAGFQSRHIRLRLHGTKLPKGYTIGLRLPSGNDRNAQPGRPKRKRRRVDPTNTLQRPAADPTTDSEDESLVDAPGSGGATPIANDTEAQEAADASEVEDEGAATRSNNAYTGATNTIGSVHQRHWFLSLDRKNSGFRRARSGPDEGRWIDGWDPFFVLGRERETSVVSGRTADEVMVDEGVKNFVMRKMWRPITE